MVDYLQITKLIKLSLYQVVITKLLIINKLVLHAKLKDLEQNNLLVIKIKSAC